MSDDIDDFDNLMIDSLGQRFWPDSRENADWIRGHYGAEFQGDCPRVELSPNPCTCTCHGCRYHCAACWRP